MNVKEPMTLATDYLLCVAAAVFAARSWRTNRMFALAFLCTALASFFGGTYHGLLQSPVLWKATVFSVGFASFFLLAAYLPRIAVVKLVAYTSWMIVHDDFLWVIVDYGITLLLVGAMQLVRRGPATPWILGSIAVSVLGAIVQQQRFALHQHFNHNDLYHLIQIAGLWLLYRGGLLAGVTTSATVRSTTLPT